MSSRRRRSTPSPAPCGPRRSGHRPQEATIASSLPRISDRSSGAPPPPRRVRTTGSTGPGLPRATRRTRTSIHPSSRVRTVSALATPWSPTTRRRARTRSWPSPPRRRGPTARLDVFGGAEPSGGSVPPHDLEIVRDPREPERPDLLAVRSRPTRYQCPPRTASPNASNERSGAFAARGPVGEPHAASLRYGLGGTGQVRVGLAAERRRPQTRQDPRSAPESSFRTASSAETSRPNGPPRTAPRAPRA